MMVWNMSAKSNKKGRLKIDSYKDKNYKGSSKTRYQNFYD